MRRFADRGAVPASSDRVFIGSAIACSCMGMTATHPAGHMQHERHQRHDGTGRDRCRGRHLTRARATTSSAGACRGTHRGRRCAGPNRKVLNAAVASVRMSAPATADDLGAGGRGKLKDLRAATSNNTRTAVRARTSCTIPGQRHPGGRQRQGRARRSAVMTRRWKWERLRRRRRHRPTAARPRHLRQRRDEHEPPGQPGDRRPGRAARS